MQIILFISSLLVFVQVMKILSFMLHDNKKSTINADCLLQKKQDFIGFTNDLHIIASISIILTFAVKT